MAKFKLTAGAEFDTLTKQELLDALQVKPSWIGEVESGVKFSRFTSQATVASNAVDFGSAGSANELIGPQPGFVWDIRRLQISGLSAGDFVTIYQNDISPTSVVAVSLSGNNASRIWLWSQQVVVFPGETLRIVGTGLNAATTQVTASGLVREAPVSLAWKLAS